MLLNFSEVKPVLSIFMFFKFFFKINWFLIKKNVGNQQNNSPLDSCVFST